MPYGAIKIANEFLRFARAERIPLTPLKLIKLVYIAHGWHLAIFGGPLINEPAQAWQYGPVVPTLYHAVKQYRAGPITADILGDNDPQAIDDNLRHFLREVFDRYKHLSGTQLSALTHELNTPWYQTWNGAGQNAVIPDDVISRHYAERLEAA